MGRTIDVMSTWGVFTPVSAMTDSLIVRLIVLSWHMYATFRQFDSADVHSIRPTFRRIFDSAVQTYRRIDVQGK